MVCYKFIACFAGPLNMINNVNLGAKLKSPPPSAKPPPQPAPMTYSAQNLRVTRHSARISSLYSYKHIAIFSIYIIFFRHAIDFQMESARPPAGSSADISFLFSVMILKACNDLSHNTNIMHHSDRITMPPCQAVVLNTTHLVRIAVIRVWWMSKRTSFGCTVLIISIPLLILR